MADPNVVLRHLRKLTAGYERMGHDLTADVRRAREVLGELSEEDRWLGKSYLPLTDPDSMVDRFAEPQPEE